MSVKKITKQEKILCNACYEAGQASLISEIRELEKKLALAEEALGEIHGFGEYSNHNETMKIWRIANEVLNQLSE